MLKILPMPDEPSANSDSAQPAEPTGAAGSATAGSQPRWQSQEILKGATEAIILHEGQTYRLRLTRQGKLILYK
jgi:hemin uptake protein HemP